MRMYVWIFAHAACTHTHISTQVYPRTKETNALFLSPSFTLPFVYRSKFLDASLCFRWSRKAKKPCLWRRSWNMNPEQQLKLSLSFFPCHSVFFSMPALYHLSVWLFSCLILHLSSLYSLLFLFILLFSSTCIYSYHLPYHRKFSLFPLIIST